MSQQPSNVSSAVARRLRETRVLKLLVAGLAVITALVSLPLYTVAGFALLLAPFVLFVASCALVLPLDGHDRRTAQAAAQVQRDRRTEAQRHAIAPMPMTPAPARSDAELHGETRAAMEAAGAHGIHFGSAHLSDGDFLQSFAAGELRADQFRHGDHLRYAWLTLESMPFDMVEESVAQGLRNFLRRITGSHAQFHATHTHGWVRVLASLPQRTFADVLTNHADALHSTALTRFWSGDTLSSDTARLAVPPTDVSPLPPPTARRTRRYRQGSALPAAPYAPLAPRAQ